MNVKNKALAGLVISLMVSTGLAQAADLSFTAPVTVSVGGLNLTIKQGSAATSYVVGESTLTVSTTSGETFEVVSSDRYTLSTNSTTSVMVCSDSQSRVTVAGTATVIITPSSTVCTTPSTVGGGAVGGGSSGGSGSSGLGASTPAVTPATPAVSVGLATVVSPIKGAVEVQEVAVPTNGKIAVRTSLTNADDSVLVDISKNTKLTGLKAGQTLQAPVKTDVATVNASKARTLKSKTIDAAYDLDADKVKSNKTLKIQIALKESLATKGLRVYLLDETTGKTKTVFGSMNKKTGVFTARTKYLGGYTLVFTHPVGKK